MHESGGVLRTLWSQIKDTQQGVCVLASIGGVMFQARLSHTDHMEQFPLSLIGF